MTEPQLPSEPDRATSSESEAHDQEALRRAEGAGNDRHVSVGGNVEGSAIVSGDGNKVEVNFVQAPTVPRSITEQKLLNQVKAEVASRLKQSLHNAVFINLIKDTQPQQVVRLWDADVKIGDHLPQALPENITILQVFDRPEIAGRLLVLGKPGVGKTTTQLELARELCDRCERQSDYPIPVLFNLSTWKETNQAISEWIVAELNSKYGLRQDIGAQWVKELKLLPFLDGLDELDPQRQLPCIHAINRFINGESAPSYLVVGSRFEEYQRLGEQLQLNGAICLRVLTDRQIQNYLAAAHQAMLWNALAEDEDWLDLVRQPLLLSMTVLAYQGEARPEWQSLRPSKARLENLLDAYVMRMLEQSTSSQNIKHRKQPPYSSRQTRLWLVWLAQQMEQESQTEFLIERIQPFWLPTQSLQRVYERLIRLIYGLIFGPIFGLIFGLSLGLIFEPTSGLISELISGPIFELIFEPIFWLSLGLISWLIFGLGSGPLDGMIGSVMTISIFESLKWSWKEAKKGLLGGLSFGLLGGLSLGLSGGLLSGLLSGLVGGLSGGLLSELSRGLLGGLSFGLLGGLFCGLFGGLFCGLLGGLRGLSGSEIDQKAFQNQGIWKMLQIGLIRVLLYGLLSGLIFGLVSSALSLSLSSTLNLKLTISGLIFGLTSGLTSGLVRLRFGMSDERGRALGECIKHLSLRIVLYRNGYAPWNYARFLDYCTDRLILQRVGGRYRFMHKLLQEHFAAMPFEKP